MNQAVILSIGDELVLGQTVDTNSAWLSQQLAAAGCGVAAHVTVSDDQKAIESAIAECAARCDFLLISGGLGPTEDDLTRQALAAALNQPLEVNEDWLAEVRKFFVARNRPMPESNRVQAMIPRGAAMIWNTAGTAAGMDAAYQTPDLKHNCRIFVMPGVPKEMKIMFARDVLPHVRAAGGGAVILSRTLHTYGLGESAIAEKLGPAMMRSRNPSVGTTVSEGQVSLRLNARFPDAAQALEELDKADAACRAALGDLVYGQDDDTLPEVVGRLLASAGDALTVATAESCTGGLLASMLTGTPASSEHVTHGWVTYSEEAKQEQLGVPAEVIHLHGVVSEPVAVAMAAGALANGHADFALSVTGVAGPDSDPDGTPVGTVCIGLADAAGGTLVRTFNFPGDREMVRDRAAKMALTMLRFHLLAKPLPF